MKIGINEIYLLSEISEKIDFNMPEFPTLNIEATREEKEKANKDFGTKILVNLFKGMYKAQEPINELIKKVIGKDPKEMDIKEIKESLTKILNEEGILDFFK